MFGFQLNKLNAEGCFEKSRQCKGRPSLRCLAWIFTVFRRLLSLKMTVCVFFSSEFEPLDTQKEDYIKTVLINRFDEQLVNTTRLRKTGPHTMKSHIKKIIRPELKYLVIVLDSSTEPIRFVPCNGFAEAYQAPELEVKICINHLVSLRAS